MTHPVFSVPLFRELGEVMLHEFIQKCRCVDSSRLLSLSLLLKSNSGVQSASAMRAFALKCQSSLANPLTSHLGS